MINIVAPWARELKGPTAYLPRYYEVESGAPATTFHIGIDEGFDQGSPKMGASCCVPTPAAFMRSGGA